MSANCSIGRLYHNGLFRWKRFTSTLLAGAKSLSLCIHDRCHFGEDYAEAVLLVDGFISYCRTDGEATRVAESVVGARTDEQLRTILLEGRDKSVYQILPSSAFIADFLLCSTEGSLYAGDRQLWELLVYALP